MVFCYNNPKTGQDCYNTTELLTPKKLAQGQTQGRACPGGLSGDLAVLAVAAFLALVSLLFIPSFCVLKSWI